MGAYGLEMTTDSVAIRSYTAATSIYTLAIATDSTAMFTDGAEIDALYRGITRCKMVYGAINGSS